VLIGRSSFQTTFAVAQTEYSFEKGIDSPPRTRAFGGQQTLSDVAGLTTNKRSHRSCQVDFLWIFWSPWLAASMLLRVTVVSADAIPRSSSRYGVFAVHAFGGYLPAFVPKLCHEIPVVAPLCFVEGHRYGSFNFSST
jgi:hypothetical protein